MPRKAKPRLSKHQNAGRTAARWFWLILAAFVLLLMLSLLSARLLFLPGGTRPIVCAALGLAFLIPALFPSRWLERFWPVAVWTLPLLLGYMVFSVLPAPTDHQQRLLVWGFQSLTVLTFLVHILFVLRHAADEQKPTARIIRWWLWYPCIALMLFVGSTFFEFQRLGPDPRIIPATIQFGLVPFSMVVLCGLFVRMLEDLKVLEQRFIIMAASAIMAVGAIVAIALHHS